MNPELLGRVLGGGGDAAERALVTEYLQSRPELEVLVARARLTDSAIDPAEMAMARDRLASHLGVPTAALGFWGPGVPNDAVGVVPPSTVRTTARSPIPTGQERHPRTSWSRWLAPVAALVLIIAAIAIYRPSRPPEHGTTKVYTTTEGQQATFTLDDKTNIVLGSNATLRLVRFGEQTRTVMLERGEAYFDVASHASMPFIVMSGRTSVRVLGTGFWMRAREGRVHVAVANGKVHVTSLARTDSGVTLIAGAVGEFDDSLSRTSSADNTTPAPKWIGGELEFTKTPVETVLKTIGRWYGYEFRTNDPSLLRGKVSVIVNMQSSAEALEKLEQLLYVNLNVTGDTITLIRRSARPTQSGPRVKTYDAWTPAREVGR